MNLWPVESIKHLGIWEHFIINWSINCKKSVERPNMKWLIKTMMCRCGPIKKKLTFYLVLLFCVWDDVAATEWLFTHADVLTCIYFSFILQCKSYLLCMFTNLHLPFTYSSPYSCLICPITTCRGYSPVFLRDDYNLSSLLIFPVASSCIILTNCSELTPAPYTVFSLSIPEASRIYRWSVHPYHAASLYKSLAFVVCALEEKAVLQIHY